MKTEDPSALGRNDTAGGGGPMILISNHIYILSISYFYYHYISIKCILPIEFRVNSLLDKCNKWKGPALGARSFHLRFTPATKLFSTFITVRLVVCLKIHAGCKFDSHTRYNHVTAARN